MVAVADSMKPPIFSAAPLCILHIVGDMGVGVQGEARAVVAQHTGQGLHIHTAGDCHRSERMPLRYNYDKPEKPRISRLNSRKEL